MGRRVDPTKPRAMPACVGPVLLGICAKYTFHIQGGQSALPLAHYASRQLFDGVRELRVTVDLAFDLHAAVDDGAMIAPAEISADIHQRQIRQLAA